MGTSNSKMWLALLALGFVWGSSFILMKMALFDTAGERLFPALDVALGRIAIAGLAMAPLAWTHRDHLTRKNLPWLLIVGGLGNMLPAYFFTTAQTLIPSSVAGMLNALTPMFTLIVGVLLFRSKVHLLQVAGIAVGFVGAAVLAFQPGMGDALGQEALGGAARVLAATACYGVSVNVIRHKLHAVPAAGVAALALGLMGLPAAGFGLSGELPALALTHPDGLRGLGAMVVLAVVGTGLALVAFNRIIQRTNALFASTVTYIIPLFATMWGWLDREPLTLWHLLGGAVVLVGVWLVNRGGRKATEKAL